MTNVVSTHNNRRMILTAAGVLAIGIGAYGLGRVYPPTGPSEGTVGPAQRYQSAQVTEAVQFFDGKLYGATSVLWPQVRASRRSRHNRR